MFFLDSLFGFLELDQNTLMMRLIKRSSMSDFFEYAKYDRFGFTEFYDALEGGLVRVVPSTFARDFRYFLDHYLLIPDLDRSQLVQHILSTPALLNELRDAIYDVKPDPSDLFISSLAQFKDSGDIDVLVRHLNWMHQDISFLSHQLSNYDNDLKKLNSLRQKYAKLKDSSNRLRMRNSELVSKIKQLKNYGKKS